MIFTSCPCQTVQRVSENHVLQELKSLRDLCPALKEIFLPEGIWEDFGKWDKERGIVNHRSILLLAFKNGGLKIITSPIHRFLFEKGTVSSKVEMDYLKSLQENWFKNTNPLRRHQKARIFMGKLIELIYAHWLENNGFKIINMEAWNQGMPDIISTKGNAKHVFEVKYIGLEDDDFLNLVKSINGQTTAHSISPYTPANFLLLRVYEAAKQLEKYQQSGNKNVVVVFDEIAWQRFQIPLNDNYVDFWKEPNFLPAGDSKWDDFYSREKEKNTLILKMKLVK